jgi:hypothetical protein
MKAIDFPGANRKIAENQPQYDMLPAWVGEVPVDLGNGQTGACVALTCCFELTPEELAEVVKTGRIWHTVLTFGQPLQPQSMSLQKPGWIP